MSATRSVRIGVHGDPLPEGKLDLPELGEEPRPEELAWARAFVAQRRWRAAVTDPAPVPHEYTVREWCPSELEQERFERFVTLVRRAGRAGFFQRLRYLYWTLDGYRYWTMGWPVGETTVINRVRKAGTGDDSA